MQREIKFRGKRVDNSEWAYGFYMESILKEKKFFIMADILTKEFAQVIPETVGQYTGLKDKEDNEIFESDILKVWDADGGEYGFNTKVVWGKDGYYPAFDLEPSLDCEYNELQHAALVGSCEVIGNIHDNAELLKQ